MPEERVAQKLYNIRRDTGHKDPAPYLIPLQVTVLQREIKKAEHRDINPDGIQIPSEESKPLRMGSDDNQIADYRRQQGY